MSKIMVRVIYSGLFLCYNFFTLCERIEIMTKKRIALKIVRRVGICILTTVVLLLIGLLGVVRIMEFGPSKTARNLFVNSAIENVYKEHEIKATGPVYNSELELISSTDNVYEFGFEANGKLIEEQESRIKEITEIYGKYVVNYESFAKLSPYILPGSYAYSYLSRISRTNIWLGVSREPAFSDMKVYNYQSYTKDCFSCEVSFDLQVSYNSGSFKDYPTHMEYIFVKRSGKWYIADMVMLK